MDKGDSSPTAIRTAHGIIRKGKKFLKEIHTFQTKLRTNQKMHSNPKYNNFHKIVESFVNSVHFNTSGGDDTLNAKIQHDEIKQAIKDLKNNKSPGPPGISDEYLTEIWNWWPTVMLDTINDVCEHIDMPEEWCESCITLHFKKEDRFELKNYRPITLVNSFWMLIFTIIGARVTTYLEANNLLSPHQNGFRSKRGCMEHIETLVEIIQRRKHEGKNTILTLFDFEKAFDTVWLEGLWYKAYKLGIRGHILNFIMAAYKKQTSSVRTVNGMTAEIKMSRGIRQGCPLSVILFLIFVNDLLDQDDENYKHWRGVNICLENPSDENLDGLSTNEHGKVYADDLFTLTTDDVETIACFDLIQDWCLKWNMRLNYGKTVMIIFPAVPGVAPPLPRNLKIEGHTIETKHHVRYLGVWLSWDLSFAEHLKMRIKTGNNTYHEILPYLKDPTLHAKPKILIIKERLISRVIYGYHFIEMWHFNKTAELQTIIDKAIRAAFNIHPFAGLKPVRTELGIPTLHTLNRAHIYTKWCRWANTPCESLRLFIQHTNDTSPYSILNFNRSLHSEAIQKLTTLNIYVDPDSTEILTPNAPPNHIPQHRNPDQQRLFRKKSTKTNKENFIKIAMSDNLRQINPITKKLNDSTKNYIFLRNEELKWISYVFDNNKCPPELKHMRITPPQIKRNTIPAKDLIPQAGDLLLFNHRHLPSYLNTIQYDNIKKKDIPASIRHQNVYLKLRTGCYRFCKFMERETQWFNNFHLTCPLCNCPIYENMQHAIFFCQKTHNNGQRLQNIANSMHWDIRWLTTPL